jgi:hypothetical protein
MEPQVEDVHEAGVAGAAGADGIDADVDEPGMPPPQALKAAIAITKKIARCEHCIATSSLCLVLSMSAEARLRSYLRKRRGAATNAGNCRVF